MKKVRIYPAAFAPAAVALLATLFLLFNAHDRNVVANERGPSSSRPRADLNQFVGCWQSGDYTLYLAVFGNELLGKIRHGEIGREDPQRIYNVSVEGTTMTGKWMSDMEFKHKGEEKGKKRRGTFMMTREGNQLNGTAKEGDDSEVQEFRGREWPWNWTRQTDTKMCEEQGSS